MNIANNVERIARAHPGRQAIVFEGKDISYGALDACACALANSLKANGVRRGDRIALYLPNIPAFMLAYLAGEKVGAIVVSVNSIFKSEEVKYLLNDSGAKVVFTTAELLPNVPRNLCPSVRKTVICEGEAAGEIVLGDWLAAGKPTFRTEDMAADDPAVLLYSSGTTGFPKGVTLTHNNIITNTRAAVNCSGHASSDRLAIFLPLFHVFAQNYIMNAGFVAGATLVLFRRFVPDVVLDAIERERVTMFFGVPTIYIALLGANVPKQKLASIRYYFSAAATMPQEISRRWTETYGPAVHEGYGLTECSPCAAYNHVSKHKFGSVGTAIEDFEVKIFDENDKEVAARNLGRDRDARTGRDEGILGQARGDGAGAAQRLAALGRHRQDGRGRLCVHRRPGEGHDQRVRLQGLAGRDRALPVPDSRNQGSGRIRPARHAQRRECVRRGGAQGRRAAGRGGSHRLVQGKTRRLQDPGARRDCQGTAQERDRQDSEAHAAPAGLGFEPPLPG